MTKRILFFHALSLALISMIFSCCSPTESKSPSKLAKLIPEEAWLIATIRPGQIQEKMDYDSFIHMPAIASLYTTSSLFESVDLEDEKELEMAIYITQMIEDPSQSGIELEEDSFFFAGKAGESKTAQFIPPLPSFGFIVPLSDHEKFETMIELMLEVSNENDDVRRSSHNNKRFIENEYWVLAIADDMAFFQGSISKNSIDDDDVVKLLESPRELEPDFANHLSKPFDAGMHMRMNGYFDWITQMMGNEFQVPDELIEQMKDGTFTYEISGDNGQFTIKAAGSYGDAFPYDFAGGGVGDALLSLLPLDSIASATVSIDMGTVRKWLNDISDNLGELMDLPPMDEPLDGLGLTPDEALSAFSGNIAASLIDFPQEDAPPGPSREIPEFVLAIETVDPAGKIYQMILKNKLLALFDENGRDPLQMMGISLAAKDNRLIISSRGQAELLRSGKAANPIKGKKRELLASGYISIVLDFGKLLQAYPISGQDLAEEEEMGLSGLAMLDLLSFQSVEKNGAYEATFSLSLKDRETNFFEQLASFIGNVLDPAWRDPEYRPRIEAARKLAAEKPDHFSKGMIGTWKSQWNESEQEYGINKFIHKEDGNYSGESLNIYKEGYEFEEYNGTWNVAGTSFLTYDENGLLEWVGGIVEMSDEKIEYYDTWPSSDEFEVLIDYRVADDWELPDPPDNLSERIFDQYESPTETPSID